MKDMYFNEEQRDLCRRRDKEFLALYHPTLDALLEQGMPSAAARREAVKFTIANGNPHYHVDHENAYRVVCHLLNARQKNAFNARTYRTQEEMALHKNRLRRQMWFEIAQRVSELRSMGLSVSQALDHVLEHCRATRFFITPSTAITKICTQARQLSLR